MRHSPVRDDATRLVRKYGPSAYTAALEEVAEARREKNARLEAYRCRVAAHVAKLLRDYSTEGAG